MQAVSKTTPGKREQKQILEGLPGNKTRRMTEQKALQEQLLQEIERRKISSKNRTSKGMFDKKNISELSWRNYVRAFFKQHIGFHIKCCLKSYTNADSYITHYYRHHMLLA